MKKNKKIIEKLTLNKETIAELNSAMLVSDTNNGDPQKGTNLDSKQPNMDTWVYLSRVYGCTKTVGTYCRTVGGIACTVPYTCAFTCSFGGTCWAPCVSLPEI